MNEVRTTRTGESFIGVSFPDDTTILILHDDVVIEDCEFLSPELYDPGVEVVINMPEQRKGFRCGGIRYRDKRADGRVFYETRFW